MNDKYSEINILLTSVGRRSYLVDYFKNAISSGTVHVANSTPISPALQRADYSVVTPLIYDEDYIPFLLDYCTKHKITAIISLYDIDLPILSKYRDEFSQIGTKVIVSEDTVLEVCNDKWKTYQYLKAEGFNVPRTYISVEDALTDIKDELIRFPVIIKPRWGMGSLSIYEVENEIELSVFYKKIKRNLIQSVLKYESLQDYDSCILIQEKLIGQEYGIDVINNLEGVHQASIVKKKYAMRSGETDCAIVVDEPQIKELGKQLGRLLGHIGNLDVDIFQTQDKLYVLEMNARFGGGYPFSHMAGVDLPSAIVKWLSGEEVNDSLLQEKYGVIAHKDISMVVL